MNRQELLISAQDAVARRPKAYGPPEQNFDRIAARWRVHIKNRFDIEVPIDPVSVAAMCADLKLARIEETPNHEDSWRDLAGYAACGAEVSTAKAEAPAPKVLAVGARVRVKPHDLDEWRFGRIDLSGREAVVVAHDPGIDAGFPWLVQSPGWTGGHNGGSFFESRNDDCRWVKADDLELL